MILSVESVYSFVPLNLEFGVVTGELAGNLSRSLAYMIQLALIY